VGGPEEGDTLERVGVESAGGAVQGSGERTTGVLSAAEEAPLETVGVESESGEVQGSGERTTGVLSAAEEASLEAAVMIACQFGPVVERKRRRQGAFTLPSVSTVRAVLHEAVQSAAVTFGTRAAEEWADGFVFTPAMRGRDATLLRNCGGDFVQLCAHKRAKGARNRLSVRRVRALVTAADLTDPRDLERLVRIAEGLHITTPVDFEPSGFENRPPLRRKYKEEVAHAVNKLLSLQWDKDTVLLLPTETVAGLPGVHFSPQHWVLKAGKAQGRPICDTSNPNPESDALNGTGKEGKDAVRQAIAEEWGSILHPTLESLVKMVLEMVDKYGAKNLVLWKKDLASAFNLMDFDAASAILLAFELTDGMTAVHTTGMFGWTGTPYAFQVITRVMVDLCRKHLEGLMSMYVDDMLGVAHKDHVEKDMATADGLARGLLGPDAIAEDKTEWGRALDWIGWRFDLDTMTVSASRRNMLKAMHAFFFVSLEGTLSLSEVERMASYASRYSVLCAQMRPYAAALHAFKTTFEGDHNSRKRPSELVKCDVVMWQSFFCLLQLDPANFARPLDSFRQRTATVQIEYDASLTGLGVMVSTWSEESRTFVLRGYSALTLPFMVDRSDASRQNTNEYLAVLMALLLIRQEGYAVRGYAYDVIGDSTSSLSWCAKGRARSQLATAANIAHNLLAVEMDISLVSTKHIPGDDNIQCDGLSRGKSGPDVGLPAELSVVLGAEAVQYIRLCDPANVLLKAEQHVERSKELLGVLRGQYGADNN
jgi:hypothetical protein